MPLNRLLTLFLLCGGLLALARAQPVIVVKSEESQAYEASAQAFIQELPAGQVRQVLVSQLASEGLLTPRLYVALGADACAELGKMALQAPALCTLLPRFSYERVLRESGRRAGAAFSALYLNQPMGRQLDLIRLALPKARRIGVLYGANAESAEPGLEAAAQARGLRVVAVSLRAEETVFTGLRKVLEDSDVLLAMADPQVYNASTLQNILLTSFRAQVPMLAFSPAYVRAGALMSVYSTPAQIGQQAGVLARGVLQGQPLGLPQYPLQFEVSVNDHVARSLGVRRDAANLTERLRRLERGP